MTAYVPPPLIARLLPAAERELPAPQRVVIYARISKDEVGRKEAIERQVPACREYCESRGWTVSAVYSEVTSATKTSRRAEYERMIADVRAGVFDGIVVWDTDRLTRKPRENEDVIDLYERFGIQLGTVGGDYDLATPTGRMMFRLKGIVAAYEVDQLKRRLHARFDQRASFGLPHSPAAYGYRRMYLVEDGRAVDDPRGLPVLSTHDELVPAEAEVIRRAAQSLLEGLSLRSVTADLNRRGVPSPRGKRWESSTLRQLLLRERNAGRRIHRGEVVGDGRWPSVYEDPATHDQVVALLTDPGRRASERGSARVHLLTGLLVCGKCGSNQTVVNKNTAGTSAYVCRACGNIRRKQEWVDAAVESLMIKFLTDREALAELAAGDPAEVQEAEAEVRRCQARLNRAADALGDAETDAEEEAAAEALARVKHKLLARITKARSVIAASRQTSRFPFHLAGETPEVTAINWARASLDERRLVIDLAWTITLLPQRGRTFNPEAIRFERKVATPVVS